MSSFQSATRIAPYLLRGTPRASLLRRGPRSLPRDISAIAILVPRRALATETSTSSGVGGGFPPPGFNADEAKKPLPKEPSSKPAQQAKQQQQHPHKADKSALAKDVSGQADLADKIESPKTGLPAHPKTEATEASTLTELAAEKAALESTNDKKLAKGREEGEEEKKLTIWDKIKKEVVHYWDGTKLLAAEVRISSKLAYKMAAGYDLTRRENRQLQRTVKDLGRLVPFSVFVIVPFAELLLPVALKLFPNLLPSTYEGQKAKDDKATNLRATRKEVSKFLKQTLRETGLPVSAVNTQKEEFTEFFRKVRTTGGSPTQEEVIKVCKIFKDDLTLDNLSRPQLVAICRYLNLPTFGTDPILRYYVRHHMRKIKVDDKAIWIEGVDTLSVTELQNACASRGIKTHGVSPGRLRDDLQTWLELRLKYGVPSTLLVLSNAFIYALGKESEINSQIDALQAVLASIPEELFHEIELEVHSAEGAATNKQRLEVLKEQQELIEEENEQSKASGRSVRSTPKDDKDIDEKEEHQASAKSEGESEALAAKEGAEAEVVGEATEQKIDSSPVPKTTASEAEKVSEKAP